MLFIDYGEVRLGNNPLGKWAVFIDSEPACFFDEGHMGQWPTEGFDTDFDAVAIKRKAREIKSR